MKEDVSVGGAGTSLPTVLFLIFLVLKLTGNIDWSWWWVTSPLWISVGFIVVVVGGILGGMTWTRWHSRRGMKKWREKAERIRGEKS